MQKVQGAMRSLCLVLAVYPLLGTPAPRAEGASATLRLPCFRYSEVARQLKGTYEETPVSLGLQANGNLLQVFNSPKRGSWTIVSTSPDGSACVLAAGRNWENVKPENLDPAA